MQSQPISQLNNHPPSKSELLEPGQGGPQDLGLDPSSASPSSLKLHIIQDFKNCPCPFWVALNKPNGTLKLQNFKLTGGEPFLTQLEEVGLKGIQSPGDILMSTSPLDNSHLPCLSVFLLPPPAPLLEEADLNQWCQRASEVVGGLSYEKIGFYFFSDLFPSPKQGLEVLSYLLKHLFRRGPLKEAYLLQGTYDYNELLQMGLSIKSELLGQAQQDLWLYH